MKKTNSVFISILFITLAACATISNTPILAGKWRLSETLSDPGDGSGKWNPVAIESFVTFHADGTVTSTEHPSYRSYAVLESNKIEFTLVDGKKQIVTYQMEGASLMLSPQCIEACGSRYVKVN